MAFSPVTIGIIASLIILVILSGLFSATETAFTSVNKIKLKKLEEDGNKKAAKASKLVENYEKLITTILVGNNLVNIVASSLSTILFVSLVMDPAKGALYATITMLIVILIFGEITPKCLAKMKPESFVLKMTPFISFISIILTPITIIFEKMTQRVTHKAFGDDETPTLTESELMMMVDEIEEEGELEAAESELIKSAIRFDDKYVDEIITPRVDIVGIERNTTMDEARNLFIQSGYSRLPVFEGTIDRIIGVIYSKDFFARYFLSNRDESINPIIRRVRFIPESTTLAQALDEVRRSTVQMLVVVDDYGGTIGIVALEDILEELVGEIWDESDEVRYDVVPEDDGSYTVLGDANIHDLLEMLELPDDLGDYDGSTVGGYIQYRLQKPPSPRSTVKYGPLEFTVTAMRNKRVKVVRLTVASEEAQEDTF